LYSVTTHKTLKSNPSCLTCNIKMHSGTFFVLSSSLYLLVVVTASEPTCEQTTDFEPCRGDIGNFCPSDIECVCVNLKPQCSCPYYKGPKGDYWYMGAKCDQLWTTRDLIFVTVLPGVALAAVIAVIAQLIYHCKTSASRKTSKSSQQQKERLTSDHQQTGNQRQQIERQSTNYFQNQGYVSNENPIYTDQMRNSAPMPPQRMRPAMSTEEPLHNGGRGFQYVPSTSQTMSEGPVNTMPHTGHFQPKAQLGYPDMPLPDEDYITNQRPNYQQNHRASLFPKVSTSVPQADYRQASASQWTDTPYMFARPQIRNDYRY
ncbi:uncharacterized protein XB5889122.L, partial [Xenopus laevis]|uniref:Uncharacterized protein XB5889122.L n=1 Tax=Xenopus laevis TaxID=8355 RepID=A0A8J0TIT5_XENLA